MMDKDEFIDGFREMVEKHPDIDVLEVLNHYLSQRVIWKISGRD